MSYKHVLVAVDLTPSSQKVIEKAIFLAKRSSCKLSFVFVDVNRVALTPREEMSFKQELQDLADQSDYPVTNTLVAIGDLHIKLSAIVKEMNTWIWLCVVTTISYLVVCFHRCQS